MIFYCVSSVCYSWENELKAVKNGIFLGNSNRNESASKLEDVSLAFWLPWLVVGDLCLFFFSCILFPITRAGGILEAKCMVCTYYL